MEKSGMIEKIKEVIAPLLEAREICLVEVNKFYQGGALFLRIIADKQEGGITLQECAELNKAISAIFDERQILEEGFILEISSPGLDRPLVTKSDFLRCKNRQVRFFLREAINSKIELEGIIARVENDSVYANLKGEILEIPLEKISRAKQIVV